MPEINGLDLLVMEVLWTDGPSTARAVHDALPAEDQPKINTTRAAFYRLQHAGYIRRVMQLNHSAVFEAAVGREDVYNQAIDAFADLFRENMGAVVARLVETGRLGPAEMRVLGRVLAAPPARPRPVAANKA